jgi:hypothetical protein
LNTKIQGIKKTLATSFQKHQKAKTRQCFRNVVASLFSAKMRFRPQGRIAFLPPDFPSGGSLKFNRLRLEIFQIKEKTSVFGQSVSEKIPQQRTSHLRQRRIDE